MSEIDIDCINTEIEAEIRKYASKVELAGDEKVLRVTILDTVVLDQEFQVNWWLDFVGQDIFQWNGQTFYCFDVEATEDAHIWICRLLDLHWAFPLQTEQEIEVFKQGQLGHKDESDSQTLNGDW
jgi:hypothetical protein